jgi:signal transduction histidine kinase
MSFYFLVYQILVVIVDLVGLTFGILVLRKNFKNPQNQLFFLMTIFALGWITLAYLSDLPFLFNYSILLNRSIYFFLSWFFLSAYFFSFYFPYKEKISGLFSFLNKLFLILGIFVSLLSLFTPLIVQEVKKTSWGTDIVWGRMFPLFSFLGIGWIISIGILFKKFLALPPFEKLKVKYFLLGFFIFFLANIIFNALLPQIRGTYEYYWFGNLSIIFFIGFTGYAIVIQHLFGIEVILTEILVGLIGLLLIVQIFTAQTILWRFINGLIFFLFCIFGYLLIRGVLREIKLREAIERISQAKSEFISIASHQLRTPLSAIKGYLSMILEGSYGELPEKVKRPMENVYQSNERLIKLVNDILSVSKIEAGEMEMNWEKEDLREIIKEVISELSIKAKEKSLYLKFEEPKEFPKILLDREKIRQVILNLVDNAIRYTQKGGVTVKLQMANEKLQIVVSDTGEGLTKEEKEKLFERFSRGTAGTKFWTEGAGLGLYIARRFVEMHKGRIWAESEGRGKGSTFYVELPMK